MNLFGIGPGELLLIVTLALIVFGPAKLPEIMAQVGNAINEFRRATSQLSDEFNRTIQAEIQQTRAVVEDTKAIVYDAHSSVASALSDAPAPTRTAEPTNALIELHATSGEPQANSVSVGSVRVHIEPAPSDTVQYDWETSSRPAPTPTLVKASLSQHSPAGGSAARPGDPHPDVQAAVPVQDHGLDTNDDLLPPY